MGIRRMRGVWLYVVFLRSLRLEDGSEYDARGRVFINFCIVHMLFGFMVWGAWGGMEVGQRDRLVGWSAGIMMRVFLLHVYAGDDLAGGQARNIGLCRLYMRI